MPELREQAKGRWRSILPQLGVSPKFLENRQGPCPICGGKDRFRFDDKDGEGTWYCNACGAGDGTRLIMLKQGFDFPQAAAEVRALLPDAPFVAPKPPRDEDKCRRDNLALWKRSSPLASCDAVKYLRSRGFAGPFPSALRFVPDALASQAEEGRLPAMIAKVSGPNGEGVNIHRTFLRNGVKAYRAMMPGELPDGCAIRLGEAGEHLAVAEGIETALAVTKRFGYVCWSLISTAGMVKFRPPPGVKALSIYADNDEKFGGQAAAYTLAHRLATMPNPIAVDVFLPAFRGTDWAD